jgi:hypothetical protein
VKLRGDTLEAPSKPYRKPGVCSVCAHERRREIEVGLVCRVPVSTLAARYDVSRDSVWRHNKHLTPLQRAAIMAARAPSGIDLEELHRTESEGLLAQLLAGRAKLQSYAAAAFEAGNVAAAISAERGVVDNLTLLSKLLGMLVVRHEVKHSLLVSADYLTLRDTLLRVLRKHPAAAKDVAAALHELESKAAEDIKAKANGSTGGHGNGGKPLVIEHQPEGLS